MPRRRERRPVGQRGDLHLLTLSQGQEDNVRSGHVPTAHDPAGPQQTLIPESDIFMTLFYYFAHSILKGSAQSLIFML